MRAVQDRVVYRRGDGVWVNKKVNSEMISSLHNTKDEAVKTAKEMLKRTGGRLVTKDNSEETEEIKKNSLEIYS